jgi:hypothetical protein
MLEDPIFIQRDIVCYGAMLKLYMGEESRAALLRLLADAERKLAAAMATGESQPADVATG